MTRKLNERLKILLISSMAVILIMALLQPFGINGIEKYKWLAIAGYGVMTFLGCGLSDLTTTYVFRLPLDSDDRSIFWSKRNIVSSVLTVLFIGALICSYDALIFNGTIYRGWFNADGTFTLRHFGRFCLYVAAISIFINIYFAFRSKNRTLSHHLQEATKLNHILAERYSADAREETEKDTGKKIIIRGTTKDSVELQTDNLLYIEAEGNYANVVHIANEKTLRKTVRCTMKQLEDTLADHPQIARCHRAFLVNVLHIRHLKGNSKGYQLTLNGTDQKVPVSKTYATSIYHLIENQA